MKNYYMLSFLLGLIVAFLAQNYGCNRESKTIVTDTITVYKKQIVTLTLPGVSVHDTVGRLVLSPPHRVFLSVNIDSILRVRDSLRIVLQNNAVRELLVMDTVVNDDSLHVEADCISAHMSVLLKFAPKKHEVLLPERIITKTEPTSFLEKAGYFTLGAFSLYGVQQLSKK